MNKQVNRVTNAIADDIRSHERSQKIYSLCFLAVLLLPLLLVFVSYVLGAHQLPSLAELVPSIDRWLRVYCHACIHDPLP